MWSVRKSWKGRQGVRAMMIKVIGSDCKMLTGRPQMIELLIPQQHSVELFKRLLAALNGTLLLGAF